MKFSPFDSSHEPSENPPAGPALKVPRLASLRHRLRHARDAAGRPVALIDELLFFLDDPPPGTGDRWQKGADLCESHGIATSRMAVWRFYRAEILQWRREQAPPTPAGPPDPAETDRLQAHGRRLAAERALEMLHDPRLAPGHLIGLIQNDNQRQHLQLARDQFNDRIAVRCGLEQRERFRRIDREARATALTPTQMEFYRKILAAIPADTTSSRHIPPPPAP